MVENIIGALENTEFKCGATSPGTGNDEHGAGSDGAVHNGATSNFWFGLLLLTTAIYLLN